MCFHNKNHRMGWRNPCNGVNRQSCTARHSFDMTARTRDSLENQTKMQIVLKKTTVQNIQEIMSTYFITRILMSNGK